jgi:hypothetical protein
MKTRDKELSSKGRAKVEGKGAPKANTPMARFRFAAAKAIAADPDKVRALEAKEKRERKKKGSQ